MANAILNKLAEELNELEKELQDFKQAVSYLRDAKLNVERAVEAVNSAESYHLENLKTIQETHRKFDSLGNLVEKLDVEIKSVDFPKRLHTIELKLSEVISNIESTTKSTLIEVQKASESIVNADFNGRFLKMEDLLNSNASKNQTHLEQALNATSDNVEKFKGSIRNMHNEMQSRFNEQIKEFQSLNIAERFERLQSLVTGLLSVVNSTQERIGNLERNFMDRLEKIQSVLEQNQALILQNVLASEKRVKSLIYVTWMLGVIAVIVIIFSKLIKF